MKHFIPNLGTELAAVVWAAPAAAAAQHHTLIPRECSEVAVKNRKCLFNAFQVPNGAFPLCGGQFVCAVQIEKR